MKNIFFTLFIIIITAGFLPLQAQKKLAPFITLQMPENDGKNSAAVVWHPVFKKYYTSMAGNAAYSMGVFDAKGEILQDDVKSGYDFRGIWYNPTSKRIEFNCYADGGIGHLEMESGGKLLNKKIDLTGRKQPDEQSVAVYHSLSKCIIYLLPNGTVEKYNMLTGELISTLTTLHPGCTTQSEVEEITLEVEEERWQSRNTSCVQYTGIPKAELAILNVENRSIELYDQKSGLMTKVAYNIPEGIELQYTFNFCYTNNIWWLFDKEEKKWEGYK